jgi:hypothetical protein
MTPTTLMHDWWDIHPSQGSGFCPRCAGLCAMLETSTRTHRKNILPLSVPVQVSTSTRKGILCPAGTMP